MAQKQEKKNEFDGRPLSACMKVELVVNKDSEIWLLHDRPFPALLEWAEYDEEMHSLGIVTADGILHDVGLTLPAPFRPFLLKAGKLTAIYMKNGQIQDFGIIPVTVRETMLH